MLLLDKLDGLAPAFELEPLYAFYREHVPSAGWDGVFRPAEK
jgi:hypothetical protein